MVIIGDKELSANSLTVRNRAGEDLGSMNVESFIKLLENDN